MANTTFPEALPLLIPVESRSVTLIDGANFDSKIIDITDVISDPANPLPDFGEALNIQLTRAWVLAWSVRLDLFTVAWAGTNRTNLTLQILNYTSGLAITERSEDRVRLHIPASTATRYVYTGSSIIHSKQARVHVLNQTGDSVTFDIDVWAKAW